jgi:hypothetical protein
VHQPRPEPKLLKEKQDLKASYYRSFEKAYEAHDPRKQVHFLEKHAFLSTGLLTDPWASPNDLSKVKLKILPIRLLFAIPCAF